MVCWPLFVRGVVGRISDPVGNVACALGVQMEVVIKYPRRTFQRVHFVKVDKVATAFPACCHDGGDILHPVGS